MQIDNSPASVFLTAASLLRFCAYACADGRSSLSRRIRSLSTIAAVSRPFREANWRAENEK